MLTLAYFVSTLGIYYVCTMYEIVLFVFSSWVCIIYIRTSAKLLIYVALGNFLHLLSAICIVNVDSVNLCIYSRI